MKIITTHKSIFFNFHFERLHLPICSFPAKKILMKLFTYLFFIASSLLFLSCGEEKHEGGHSAHDHPAPHGGQLVELGEHGSGFNLELVLHNKVFFKFMFSMPMCRILSVFPQILLILKLLIKMAPRKL